MSNRTRGGGTAVALAVLLSGAFSAWAQPSGGTQGCCCFPKLHPTGNDRFDCKGSMTEFDCRAECAMFKDGREPSGCTWAVGACQH